MRNTSAEGGNQYDINDDKTVLELFQKLWKGYESGSMKIDALTSTVLSRTDMWEIDLNTIPGFTIAVAGYLQRNCHLREWPQVCKNWYSDRAFSRRGTVW